VYERKGGEMQKTVTNKYVEDSSFWKPSTLSEKLGFSESTIRSWITNGSKGVKLTASEVGTGNKQNYLIHGFSVNRFLQEKELIKNPLDENYQIN